MGSVMLHVHGFPPGVVISFNALFRDAPPLHHRLPLHRNFLAFGALASNRIHLQRQRFCCMADSHKARHRHVQKAPGSRGPSCDRSSCMAAYALLHKD